MIKKNTNDFPVSISFWSVKRVAKSEITSQNLLTIK